MIDLRSIRLAAGLSQGQLADALGLKNGQATVSQLEGRTDWLLSTLADYIAAAGGTAELVVNVGGEQIAFEIA